MLSRLRSDISKIDGEILSLLHERLSLTHEVGIWKRENHQTIVDPKREAEILADLRDHFPHDPDGIESLWREIMYISKRDQYSLLENDTSLKIGIQGGRGSFNEIAVQQFLSNPKNLALRGIVLRKAKGQVTSYEFPPSPPMGGVFGESEKISGHPELVSGSSSLQNMGRSHHKDDITQIENTEIEYLYTTRAVLEALNNGAIDYGQFVIANSIGGLVDETMQSLGHYRFREVTHYEIPIIHALMIHPDAKIENITTIMGHDQALRQCEQNLMRLFPNIEKMAGTGDLTDNASIAEAVAHGTLPPTTASIGHASLADIYGLRVIQDNIQDRDDNRTTFVLVSL